MNSSIVAKPNQKKTDDEFFHKMLDDIREEIKNLGDSTPEYKKISKIILLALTQSKKVHW
jgi:hypothetical protein